MASCSREEEEESDSDPSLWKCPLCLEIYKSPKLLPCSHTFCKACLVDLVRHQRGRSETQFPCPSCREMIRMPPGGVDAFKNNYYLEATASKEKRHLLCKVHASKPRELEMFCHQCNICICLKCKLEDHADHKTEDIEETSKVMKTKLANNMNELVGTISSLKRKRNSFWGEHIAIKEKRTAVKREIMNRHRMMIQVADKCRDDALFALDTVTASINSQVDEVMNKLQKCLDNLEKLKKRTENCMKGEEGSGLLVTAQEIYRDASTHRPEVQSLLKSQVSAISRPVLRYSTTAETTLGAERRFLSGVERMDMAVSQPLVTVKQMFCCASSDQSSEVYSLFPRLDDKVWVVYEVGGPSEGACARCPQLFTFSGDVVDTERSVKGRTSFTHTNQGTGMCVVQIQGSFQTYAKSRTLVRLKNQLNGTAVVSDVNVKSESPLKTSLEPRFTIRCGLHRAFDIHEGKVLCAVVEEGQSPESGRKVHIYQQPKSEPAATYRSPVQPFQPSDVCFYKLGGHEVLLVADELNDTIHVVQLETGQMVFGGYLAAGCPLLTQPTALNTDFKGGLWVGCRSGAVLLCQPTRP